MTPPMRSEMSRHRPTTKRQTQRGLRIIALFEGAKGLLVLLTGCGVLLLIHKDLHAVATQLVAHFHINPARHYPQIFLDATAHVNRMELWVLAATALLYAVVRFIEAYGLWHRQPWAQWFGALTGALYLPLELYET